ncbi:hypothetical protein KBC54_04605 [Patescibacteria group bacterium]|nr:hypothetical protein [Patescibacteria group bacterium]
MLETLKEQWQNLQKEQKISVCLLGVCGVLVVGLSLYRLQANVVEPFLVDNASIVKSKMLIGQTPADLEALQRRTDTDGDGLSDWDETNVYHTNPNLRDSCGDGVVDNIRVATGKNINCPTNQIGIEAKPVTNGDAAATGTVLGTPEAMGSLYPQIAPGDLVATPKQDAPTSNDPSSIFSDSLSGSALARDPVMIRKALTGKVEDALLQKVSDADLLKLYDEAMAIQSGQAKSPNVLP